MEDSQHTVPLSDGSSNTRSFARNRRNTAVEQPPMCFCHTVAVLHTSRTRLNPGRRFWGCGLLGVQCDYFAWEDPAECYRCHNTIRGLNQRIQAMEAAAIKDNKLCRTRMIIICVSWLMFVGVYALKLI